MEQIKNIALAAGVSALLLGEPSVALAKTTKAAGQQGELLEELLEQQRRGEIKAKVIKGTSSNAPKVSYNDAKKAAQVIKKSSAPKATKPKPAPKPKAAPKPAAAASKPLKFSSKASSGSQGSAPAGVELPVPKGAVTSAKKAPSPKPAAAKKAEATLLAVKATQKKETPAAQKTENPLARKAKANAAVKAGATGAAVVAAEKAVVKTEVPAVKEIVKAEPTLSSSSGNLSLSNGAVQAGAVVAAEVVGVAVASSVVGGILKPKRA